MIEEARAARAAGQPARAEQLYRERIAAAPGDRVAYRELAELLMEMDRFEPAASVLRSALVLEPADAELRSSLATALLGARRLEESMEAAQAAIAQGARGPLAHVTLGAAAVELDRFADALAAFREALARDPARPQTYASIAHVAHLLGEYDAEIAALEQCLALAPSFANAHSNLGVTLLLRGEFARGWEEYLWYLRSPENRKAAVYPYLDRVPLWDGRPYAGRLVIARDQGYGDFIQMARYLPLVKARGGRLVVEVPPPLERLARSIAAIDEVRVVRQVERPLDDVDVHLPLMSLPRVFKTTPESIPAPVPYLAACARLVARWAGELAGPETRRVGLLWAGNLVHADDRHRSIALAELAPLGAVEGIAWFALQKGRDEAQSALGTRRLRPLGARIADFADTAAILAQLDLVITVDSAVAHLAGALGKPVWVLLPFVPDWRWMLEGEATPWYPTMRLFRQGRDRRWEPVVSRVAAALASGEAWGQGG